MRLNINKANFVEILYPNEGTNEDYCYAEIEEKDFKDFTDYFGTDGKMVNPDSPDWPESLQSVEQARNQKFSSVRSPGA